MLVPGPQEASPPTLARLLDCSAACSAAQRDSGERDANRLYPSLSLATESEH